MQDTPTSFDLSAIDRPIESARGLPIRCGGLSALGEYPVVFPSVWLGVQVDHFSSP